ncbi:uncharacterized protein TNCV_1817611, partial [Trichonephila clavipes]
KANEVGNREAARFFNVDELNIRLWRRNKTNFKNCDRRKRADRRGKPHWPELEAEINKWILKERDDGKAVSTFRTLELPVRNRCLHLATGRTRDDIEGRIWQRERKKVGTGEREKKGRNGGEREKRSERERERAVAKKTRGRKK